MNMENVVSLTEYAELHDMDAARLRRYVRKNGFDGAIKWGGDGGRWIFDVNAEPPKLSNTMSRGARRNDGRKRYRIALNESEYANVVTVLNDASLIVDINAVNRERRAARKLADAANAVNDANDAPLENDVDG